MSIVSKMTLCLKHMLHYGSNQSAECPHVPMMEAWTGTAMPPRVQEIPAKPQGPRGWNYVIGYWVPGPDKEGRDSPAQNYFVRIEYRDNLEAAQRIYQVLCETDVSFTAYGIILDPVY